MGSASWSYARAGLLAAALLPSGVAHASGPTERMLQALLHPSDPNVIVVRYGVPSGASDGFLFSHDGGATFKAACSSLIGKDVRLQRSNTPYVAPVALDGMGQLTVSQDSDKLFTDDGTGCTYTKTPGFAGKTVVSIAPDPSDVNALYGLVYTNNPEKPTETTSEVMRRAADGTWTSLGPIKKPATDQSVYGSDLLVAALPGGGLRMVTLFATWTADDKNDADNLRVAISDDRGKTWQEHPLAEPPQNYDVRLLAIDPTQPDRVLAVHYGSSARDKLLLSTDKGATYQPWAEVNEASSVAFMPDGRVYIGDGADLLEDPFGGLYSAAKLGDPLMKVGDESYIDCLQYRASDQKLFACQRDKFGTVDPTTGVFTALTSFPQVSELLDCPNQNSHDVCEEELNSGLSWCCAGHYPFTEFCGDYDVTMSRGRGVLCGLSGRAYEAGDAGTDAGASDAGTRLDAGSKVDAGARDAAVARRDAASEGNEDDEGEDDIAATPKKDDGCTLRAPATSAQSFATGLTSAALLWLALGSRRRRRRPR